MKGTAHEADKFLQNPQTGRGVSKVLYLFFAEHDFSNFIRKYQTNIKNYAHFE
jgi:hypothetical protein